MCAPCPPGREPGFASWGQHHQPIVTVGPAAAAADLAGLAPQDLPTPSEEQAEASARERKGARDSPFSGGLQTIF